MISGILISIGFMLYVIVFVVTFTFIGVQIDKRMDASVAQKRGKE